jgi:hypothetical protein
MRVEKVLYSNINNMIFIEKSTYFKSLDMTIATIYTEDEEGPCQKTNHYVGRLGYNNDVIILESTTTGEYLVGL